MTEPATPAARAGLAQRLRCPAWRAVLAPVFGSGSFAALASFLEAERAAGHAVLPPKDAVFAALDATPPEAARVVILGQDPYPTPGHAHGLAFSYRGGGALPRSLRNVLAEVERDLGVRVPAGCGDLSAWAAQGVLLLNTVLTVRAGEAGSHRGRGWEDVTAAVLARLAEPDRPRVFLLWGRAARAHARRIGPPHHVLEAGHPSPLSIRHFRGCGHFSRANALLDGAPIRWTDVLPRGQRPARG